LNCRSSKVGEEDVPEVEDEVGEEDQREVKCIEANASKLVLEKGQCFQDLDCILNIPKVLIQKHSFDARLL